MESIDFDQISIPQEPLFLAGDGEGGEGSEYSDEQASSRGGSDDWEIRSESSFASGQGSYISDGSGHTLRGATRQVAWGQPRECTIHKTSLEEHGFFLSIDRDRGGNIVRRIERGGPADRAGMRDGDRVLEIFGENADEFTHEALVDKIKMAGNEIVFRVIDERSDDSKMKNKPYLFRIVKGKGGYGFYLWADADGHYVQDITSRSPADRAGLRAGDRIIEINGVNIEKEKHEDVFYRIKACHNIVNLLSVDTKTFQFFKKSDLPITALKASTKFSGWKGFAGLDSEKTKEELAKAKKEVVTTTNDFTLQRDKDEDSWGFKIAFSNSFMGNEDKNGHVIHWCEKSGPADTAGIRNGDRLVGLDGKNIEDEDYEKVQVKIEKHKGNTDS